MAPTKTVGIYRYNNTLTPPLHGSKGEGTGVNPAVGGWGIENSSWDVLFVNTLMFSMCYIQACSI